MKDITTLKVSEDFYSIQCEGISTGVPAYFIRLGSCNLNSIGVKPGRHIPRIMTSKGQNKKINELKPGDKILAIDKNQKLTETEIKAVFEYDIDEHYEISVEGKDLLYVSGEHPFLTNIGWKKASELKLNDEIMYFTGKDKSSFLMKRNNPMQNTLSKEKRLKNVNYKEIGKKVSKTRRRLFREGKIEGWQALAKINDTDRYNEYIKQLSKRMKIKNPMFDSEVVKKSTGAHDLNSFNFKGYHSKTEYNFHELCLQSGFPVEYVGNYDFPVKVENNKRNIYPDFILPGTNRVFEIYWSGEGEKNYSVKKTGYKEKRKQLYEEAGYSCTFVDFTLLKKDDLKNLIKSEIEAHNGLKVKSIKKIIASKYKSLKKPLKCYDVTCFPEHTFIVDGLVTHNCGASVQLVNKLRKKELTLKAGEFKGDLQEQGLATWVCDTIPVWVRFEEKTFEYFIDKWKQEGIYEDIKSGLIHIIWTGGEPTIPMHQKAIVEFTKWWNSIDSSLIKNNKIVLGRQFKNGIGFESDIFYEIETNGTIYIQDDLFNLLSQINCSPKLSNSGMRENQRIIPNAIKRIMEHSNYQFKFVISNEDDIKEMFDTFISPFNIPLEKVVCMPGLDSQSEFFERTKFVLEMAKKYKFRGMTRNHIAAWDKTTGV